jgi:hypothetical protein
MKSYGVESRSIYFLKDGSLEAAIPVVTFSDFQLWLSSDVHVVIRQEVELDSLYM